MKIISTHHPSFRLHLLGHSCTPLVLSIINCAISTTNLTLSILSRHQGDSIAGTTAVLTWSSIFLSNTDLRVRIFYKTQGLRYRDSLIRFILIIVEHMHS